MSAEPTLQEVLSYLPKPLRFGTSGVRARVEELTDVEVYCLTRGTLAYLERIGKVTRDFRPREEIAIPLAGDLRPSTARLLEATVKAIADAGYRVDYGGRIPTPALTYYALKGGVASFVVTGSHIPADRNGQKANRCDGEVLKSDEPGIISAVEVFRAQEYACPAGASMFTPDGSFKPEYRPRLPPVNPALAEDYRNRYRAAFAPDSLEGLRVLFFEYSTAGRDLLPQILTDAGAEVIRAGRSEEFIPLDTEAVSDAQLSLLRALVEQSGPIDALISSDGDSDRPLVIGVNGAELTFFPGDLLGAVVAEFLRADAAAVPISANPVLEEFLKLRGIGLRRTRIGSPYVIEAMQRWQNEGKRRVVAWEANGGFLVGSDIPLGDGVLEALPTRDAALPILCVLAAARRQGLGLAKLLEGFPPGVGQFDLVDAFPQELSQRLVSCFALEDNRIEELRFENARVVLLDGGGRELGSFPTGSVEGQAWLGKKRLLEQVFSSRLGFSPLAGINVLDGVRCYFENGEIAHIRPSGNAPQLRIYAFAATFARAREIAALAVAQDGLLWRLAQSVKAGAA